MKQVVVSGFSGFLGRALTRLLLRSNYNVLGIAKNQPLYLDDVLENPNFEFLQMDIVDDGAWSRLSEASIIFHLAGNASVKFAIENPREDFESNVKGTLNALEYCRRTGAKMIMASTAKIYPILDMTPRSIYGTSKLAADFYVQEYMASYGLSAVVNRFVTFYGPGQYAFGVPDKSWVNYFIEANIKGIPIMIMGDGEQIRDPLYIEDAADLLLAELENEKFDRMIIDVGGGESNSTSPREIIEQIENISGQKFSEIRKIEKRRDVKSEFVADLKLISEYWQPKTSISDGLKKTYDWMMDVV
jgi:nucleoside-diphosphate-sugar epimerase